MSEIKFSKQEWSIASDLSAVLLQALGPQRLSACECGEERILAPNYSMKYELAKALRTLGASRAYGRLAGRVKS